MFGHARSSQFGKTDELHLRAGRAYYLITHWWRGGAVVYAELRPYDEGNAANAAIARRVLVEHN